MVHDPKSFYQYVGGYEVKDMDTSVTNLMYGRLDKEFGSRVFTIYIPEDREVQVWIPTTTDNPDEVWCLNIDVGNWYVKARTMNGYGFYQEQTSLTIGDLIGTIGEQNFTFGSALTKEFEPITLVGDANGKMYKLDKTTLNNDGSAITNSWESPDFVVPNAKENLNRFMRVPKLIYEAKGQSVSTHYSIDGGSTWAPTCGGGTNTEALDSVYRIYEQDFDTVTRKIRFRWLNNTVSSGFNLRYYAFMWIMRSGRQ